MIKTTGPNKVWKKGTYTQIFPALKYAFFSTTDPAASFISDLYDKEGRHTHSLSPQISTFKLLKN